jgi:hypothetical protein
MMDFNQSLDAVVTQSVKKYQEKAGCYGNSVKMFRIKSINAQIFMKLARARNVFAKECYLINESWHNSIREALSYSIIGLCLEKNLSFEDKLKEVRELVEKKDRDYDSIWREMDIDDVIDLCLVKSKRIANNREVYEDNFKDIAGYCLLILTLIVENEEVHKEG